MGTLDQYAGSAGTALGGLNAGANIYSGIRSGSPTGYLGATVNAGKLAGKLGAFGDSTKSVNAGLGDIGSGLSIYNGIRQGGVGGYGQAAIGAGQLGLNTAVQSGLMSASSAAPYLAGLNYAAIPLNLYNEVKNWESGNTGADALGGATTGAGIGTAILPGIGTAVGALLGGAAGALSSVFGNGRVDPENANWVGYTGAQNKVLDAGKAAGATPEQIQAAENGLAQQVQNPYGALAGYFDLRDNQIKGNNPLYQQYGRMGEEKFTNDLVSQIQNAQKAGTIGANDSASDIYNKVVTPWENSWGKGTSTDANAGAMQGLITQMISQYEGGTAKNNWLGRSGDQVFANLQGPTASPGGATTANLDDLNNIAAQHDAARRSMGLAPAAQQNLTAGPAATTPAPQMAVNQPGASGVLGRALGNATQQIQPTTGIQMARPVMKKGGALSRYSHKVSSFRTGGKTNYDDGGDVSFDSNAGTDSWTGFNPNNVIDFGSLDSGGSGNSNDNFSSGLSDLQNQFNQDALTNQQLGNWIDNYAGSMGDTPGTGKSGSGLSKLVGNFTGAGGLAGLLKAYTPLVGVLGSAIQSKNNKAPSLAPGMTAGSVSALPAPHFNRTPVAQPTNRPDGGQMTQQDWYTYGERPEAQFFNNNSIPLSQSVRGQAKGGQPQGALGQTIAPPGGEFNSAHQSYVGDGEEQPGDGQSDEVPAKLSKGEFVMDAHTVSTLGNGSNSAGAQKLERLRQNIRKHAAKSNSKGKQFMHAKEPEQYMNQGKPKAKAAAGAR